MCEIRTCYNSLHLILRLETIYVIECKNQGEDSELHHTGIETLHDRVFSDFQRSSELHHTGIETQQDWTGL